MGIPRLSVGNLVGKSTWTFLPPFINSFVVGGQAELALPDGEEGGPISAQIYASIDIADFVQKSWMVVSFANLQLGKIMRAMGIKAKLPAWLDSAGFKETFTFSLSMVDQTAPSGDAVVRILRVSTLTMSLRTEVDRFLFPYYSPNHTLSRLASRSRVQSSFSSSRRQLRLPYRRRACASS